EKTNCINANTRANQPFQLAASVILPPRKSRMSFGKTGMISPIARISRVTVTRMKTIAAGRLFMGRSTSNYLFYRCNSSCDLMGRRIRTNRFRKATMKVGRLFLISLTALFLWNELDAQSVSGIKAARVAAGLRQPLFATAPPGDFDDLFIVQQTGQVFILNLSTGAVNPTPFIDISSRLTATNGEQGLLGMAFDPDYATNQRFYLDFTVPGGAWGNGTTHVSQFHRNAKGTKMIEKILLTFDHPQANHNGGWIGFSPRANDNRNLYISTGDGGAGDDQGPGHIEPGGNSQNKTTLLGKMLRIHVKASGAVTIPRSNPF